MAQVIFYVCFDDFVVNWISFFFVAMFTSLLLLFFSTLFLCSTHLLFIWLKEELSRVNSIAVYSHTHTHTYSQTKFTKCVSTAYVNISIARFSFCLVQLSQVSRYTFDGDWFLFVHIVKKEDELFALWNREILWTSVPMRCVTVNILESHSLYG